LNFVEKVGACLSYQLPKCSCGADLQLYYEEAVSIETKINKNGMRSKKFELTRLGIMTTNFERLRCYECFREWDFNEDEKGRIVKGKAWEEVYG
jgi:hypothetical protein